MFSHIIKFDTFTGKPLGESFRKSANLLNSAVSIPISVNQSDSFNQIVENTFESIDRENFN
jgi:hypothetical protein